MVPFWRIAAAKRLALGNALEAGGRGPVGAFHRMRDFLRFNHPLKLDFCRLSAKQMMAMVRRVSEAERKKPGPYRPIVAIGHSKDLTDISAVKTFLEFLIADGVAVATFRDIYPKLAQAPTLAASTGDSEVALAPEVPSTGTPR
jgi:hypothetical protein